MSELRIRSILGAVAICCIGLGGCVDRALHLSAAPSSAVPDSEARSRGEVDVDFPQEQDSYFREYTPWRTSGRRTARALDLSTQPATPPVRVSSLGGTVVGAAPTPELPPQDPAELEVWLAQRRERSNQSHLAHQARIGEMDKNAGRAIRSICNGC